MNGAYLSTVSRWIGNSLADSLGCITSKLAGGKVRRILTVFHDFLAEDLCSHLFDSFLCEQGEWLRDGIRRNAFIGTPYLLHRVNFGRRDMMNVFGSIERDF